MDIGAQFFFFLFHTDLHLIFQMNRFPISPTKITLLFNVPRTSFPTPPSSISPTKVLMPPNSSRIHFGFKSFRVVNTFVAIFYPSTSSWLVTTNPRPLTHPPLILTTFSSFSSSSILFQLFPRTLNIDLVYMLAFVLFSFHSSCSLFPLTTVTLTLCRNILK